MTSESSLPSENRREFVRKSLAASIIAAQPTILAGLVRAEGGGSDTTGTTDPWETTYETSVETSEFTETTEETTAPADVCIWEMRTFAQKHETGGPYSSEPLCESAAKAKLWSLISQSTFVTDHWDSPAGKIQTLKMEDQFNNNFQPITIKLNPDGTYSYEITIPAATYTVIYWV